jgi:hypothetical protein
MPIRVTVQEISSSDQTSETWSIVLFLFKTHNKVSELDSVPVFRWNLLSWAKSIELIPISGHQHQHKIGYKTAKFGLNLWS